MNIRTFVYTAPLAKAGIGVLLALIAFSCIKTPLEPILPASDIQMSIPIIDRTRTVADLYGKPASNVDYDSTLGTYVYQSTQASKPVPLDTLKATPHDQSSVVALGKITLPGLPGSTQALTASSLGIAPVTYPGPPVPTPPTYNVRLPGTAFPSNTQFDWLATDTGSVTLSVTNTLPLQVDFPQGLRLKNNSTNPQDTTTIAFFNVGLVDSAGTPGSTVTKTVNISKKFIYAALQTDSIRFNTITRSTSFTISSSSGISFTFSSGSFVVDSATAVIPNQVLVPTADTLFTVDDSVTIQDADFRSGTFNAVLQNHSNVSVSMYLQFNDLINTQTGQSFLINQVLPALGSITSPVSLNQYRIQTAPSALGTKLSFRLGISSISSAAKVAITSHDFISAGIQVGSPFVIKSVTGKIKPTVLAVNTGASGVSLGDATNKLTVDSVNFSSESIALNLGIYSGFVMDYNLTLQGISRKVFPNKVISYPVPGPNGGSQHRIIPTPGKLTQIVLDNSTGFQSFLNQFFPSLPDTFIVTGTVTLNPSDVFPTGLGSATIYDTSKVYSSISVFFPMKMGISNATYRDVINIKGTFDSSFVSDVKSGSLHFSIDNGLPLNLAFGASFMGRDSASGAQMTLLTIPIGGSLQQIAGSSVDPATGEATTPNASTFSISLLPAEVQQLAASDSVALTFQLGTSGTPPTQPIVLSASNTIHVRASANMVYTVNKKKN